MPPPFIPQSRRARYFFCRPRLYCLRAFIPLSCRARHRARYFIFRALRQLQGHILAHIGHPNLYDWVIWWVSFLRLKTQAHSMPSYNFHSSISEGQGHWTVRAVHGGYVYHTLHVFADGRRADSFNNGGQYWRTHRMYRRTYRRL